MRLGQPKNEDAETGRSNESSPLIEKPREVFLATGEKAGKNMKSRE